MRKQEAKKATGLDGKLEGYTVPDTGAYWQNFEKILDKNEARAARRRRTRFGIAVICLAGLVTALGWLFYSGPRTQPHTTKISAPAGESKRAEKTPARNSLPTPQTEIGSPDHTNTSAPESEASSHSAPTRTIQQRGIGNNRKGGSIHSPLSDRSSKINEAVSYEDDESLTQETASDIQSKSAPERPEKMKRPLLDPLFQLTLNEPGPLTHTPLIQKSKKNNARLMSETGLIVGAIGTAPSYPGTGITMKPAFKAGLYREQKLVNRFTLLTEPCLVYRTGYDLEKSSVQNRYFLTHQIEKTSVRTRGILSLDVPLALQINMNRHAVTGGAYASFLLNTLSTVKKTSQTGKSSSETGEKNAWNYKAGFRKTAYGVCTGYIFRKDEHLSFTVSYILFLSSLAQPGYYEGGPTGMSELQFGLRYKLLNK